MMRDPLRTRRRAEQDMGMPAATRRWSRAEVQALIDDNPLHSPRYEVVDGELLVTPSPGGPHQFAVLELARELATYCDRTGIGRTMVSPFAVELESGTLVQPDVFVVPPAEAARLQHERTARAVLLAVEILSPGSERGDRGRKRTLYQRTVPEYWLMDVESRHVDRWRSSAATAVRVAGILEWAPTAATPPFTLDLQGFFARVRGEQPGG